MTHILYFSHKTESSSYFWYNPLKISFHEEKCCQLPFRSWSRRPTSVLQKLSEKNTIITKEPNVSSSALWDSRCLVISRIFFSLWFCSYTDHHRKRKKGGGGIEKCGTTDFHLYHSVLCISWIYQLHPTYCPQNRGWEWMHLHCCCTGQGRSSACACMCLLLIHALLIFHTNGRVLFKDKATV